MHNDPRVHKYCIKKYTIPQLLHHLKKVRTKTPAGNEVLFDSNGDAPPLHDFFQWQMTSEDTSRFLKLGTFDANGSKGQKFIFNSSAIKWGGRFRKGTMGGRAGTRKRINGRSISKKSYLSSSLISLEESTEERVKTKGIADAICNKVLELLNDKLDPILARLRKTESELTKLGRFWVPSRQN
ncbi:hypothetical protein NDU88_004396 [Pleurodeles waltl]|uniref:Uncharacterized protein n=1 Tax=Pleurodeles waltl TaxID=8319 RepID=A0AAV7PJP4_PLEWA|nr:hypothetical protein NDU88_004396 [Pleurodeles waltl]